jgi:tetratricopeptide (TPR) repeat protein
MNAKNVFGRFASVIVLLSGCAVETHVQGGRTALLYGEPTVALASFQKAAELDPNALHFSVLPQGIWTYVGRANYSAGKYPEARQALERAVSLHEDDSMARLYLGLALARVGERQKGLSEIEGGLRGLHDWLDYVNQFAASSYGQYWDPLNEIRAEIRSSLGMISTKAIDWQKLMASGEWVGRKIEEEIDIAQRQESQDQYRGDETSGE